MAENSFIFDSANGDRKYTSQNFADYYKTFIKTGVIDIGSNLAVSLGTGNNVVLSTGKAIVEGRYYENTANLTLAVATTATTRIDRLVLRLDTNASNRYIKAFIVQGTTTQPPALTRAGTVYEISLAKISVTPSTLTLTDERLDYSVCGVSGLQRQVNPVYYGYETYTDSINASSALTKTISIPDGMHRGWAVVKHDIYGIMINFSTDNSQGKISGVHNGDQWSTAIGTAWTARSLGGKITSGDYGDKCTSNSTYININEFYIDDVNNQIKITFNNSSTSAASLNCSVDWEVE